MLAGCKDDSGGNTVDDRFVGRWLSARDNISFLEFTDSSHLTFFNSHFGWTAKGPYTFTGETIFFDAKIEFEGEEYSFSETYMYYLTENYLQLITLPDAIGDSLGMATRYFKQ
jgi:hypothetical protein